MLCHTLEDINMTYMCYPTSTGMVRKVIAITHISQVMPCFVILRVYLMVFWLSPEVSTRDPIISLRTIARGLIMVEG